MKIWSIFNMFNYLKFIIWCYLVHSNYAARRLVSPCPNVFQFEGEPENDRWSGVINFSSNIELAGLTYKIQLDRPSQLLVSWDGEVRTDDNTLYHVNNQYRVQRPGEMGRAQIMVKFDPVIGPPEILKIVINGNTVCSRYAEGKPSGQNSGNRVPGVVLSADSTTTERFDPSFNENEEVRPDYPYGSQNSNSYGTNFNQGNQNSNIPNRSPSNLPNGNNYGNANIPANNYGNSNGPYGGTSNTNSGSSSNPIYSNSNQANHNGPPDVHYSYNPSVQSGSNNYGNSRPQLPDNNFNNNNPNQGTNWPNNGGFGGTNTGFSNPTSANNNPQSNSPYNGTVVSSNNPQQLLQLFNSLLNQQQTQNASSPTFVVAILPVPSTSEPVVTRIDPPITTEVAQKPKTTAFTNSTTSTVVPITTSTSSVINRTRTSTSSNTKGSNSNANNNNSNSSNNNNNNNSRS